LSQRSLTKKHEWVNNSFGHLYLGRRLYLGQTPFQRMEIFQNETFGTLLFLDGKIQISERDEDRYHQYLVDAPLLAHAAPKSICIIGGGDCFGLEEAVKHKSLQRILMVEIDEGVVNFCEQHYPAIKEVLKDPRIQIVFRDARGWLHDHKEAFDVLAVDLTEPHGPSKMLYTREFYRLCRTRLNPGGILSIHTDNYTLFPESFATIYKTLKSVFPSILTSRVDMPCFGMGWTYRMASAAPLSYARLAKNTARFARQGHILNQFTPSTYRVEPTPEELGVLKHFGRISTDARPYDKFEKLEKKVTR
jgi:spermidine synthase